VSVPIIPDPKPRRNRASARKAGTAFERGQADYLAVALNDDRIDRRVKTGAADKGDIAGVRTLNGARVVIECKNTATMSLPAWLREAETERVNDGARIGVVMHKRRGTSDPAEQYVTMTAATFALLLKGGTK